MLITWAIIFGIVAIVLALFGFRSAAGIAITVAKILAVIFLIVFLVTLVLALL